MKLELKHLAPYLPYGLEIMSESEPNSKEPNIVELKSIDMGLKMVNFGWGNALELDEFKPILRPLSDLNKGKCFIHQLRSQENLDTLLWAVEEKDVPFIEYYNDELTHSVLEYLYENHFDIFQLIEKGLAIDINTLK